MSDVWRVLARARVPAGFAVAVVVLVRAVPTSGTWAAGFAVALAGEAIRLWAAGHLEKSREVTRSGPYRWTRHPLSLGSCVIAAGVILASASPLVAVVGVDYMCITIAAAVRTE